jgi:hypothetical protein
MQKLFLLPIAFGVLVVVTGCETRVPLVSKASLLPERRSIGGVYQQLQNSPSAGVSNRLAWYEANIRAGARSEPFVNYFQGEYPDYMPWVYPTTKRLNAASEYVLMAKDFERASDPGAASRAYWAALVKVSGTFASRPDKEQVRQVAYEGLRDLAKQRNQIRWAELLDLPAQLCGIYAKTPQANRDHSEFYKIINAARRDLINEERAQRELERQQMMAAFAAGMGQLNANIVANSGNYQQAMDMQLNTFRDTMIANVEIQSGYEAVRDSLMRASGGSEEFLKAVAEDVTEVEAGHSFVAREVLFFLSTAENPSPYLPILQQFASDKPPIAVALSSYSAEPSSSTLLALGKAITAQEVQVARSERQPKVP